MRRALADGYELDDDPARIDFEAVFAYIAGESYWGRGRSRELVRDAIDGSQRVVGLYRADGAQAGFARAVTDGATVGYLADVYVLEPDRGRGLGLELVREVVEGGRQPGSGPGVRWLLHTADAQGLYERLGFSTDAPSYTLMERARRLQPPSGRHG